MNLQAPAKDPAGYVFSYWKLNGVAQAPAQKSKSLTFTMTAGTTVVAVYVPTCTLTVQSTPPTGVSVGSNTGNSGTTSYTCSVGSGTSVNLQAPATDPAGYTFSYWTLNGAAQASDQKAITFTMTAATTAVARYTLNAYTLSVQSTPPTGLSIGSSTGHGGTTNYTKASVAYGTKREPSGPGDGPGRVHLFVLDAQRRGADCGPEGHHVHVDRRHDGGGPVRAGRLIRCPSSPRRSYLSFGFPTAQDRPTAGKLLDGGRPQSSQYAIPCLTAAWRAARGRIAVHAEPGQIPVTRRSEIGKFCFPYCPDTATCFCPPSWRR